MDISGDATDPKQNLKASDSGERSEMVKRGAVTENPFFKKHGAAKAKRRASSSRLQLADDWGIALDKSARDALAVTRNEMEQLRISDGNEHSTAATKSSLSFPRRRSTQILELKFEIIGSLSAEKKGFTLRIAKNLLTSDLLMLVADKIETPANHLSLLHGDRALLLHQTVKDNGVGIGTNPKSKVVQVQRANEKWFAPKHSVVRPLRDNPDYDKVIRDFTKKTLDRARQSVKRLNDASTKMRDDEEAEKPAARDVDDNMLFLVLDELCSKQGRELLLYDDTDAKQQKAIASSRRDLPRSRDVGLLDDTDHSFMLQELFAKENENIDDIMVTFESTEGIVKGPASGKDFDKMNQTEKKNLEDAFRELLQTAFKDGTIKCDSLAHFDDTYFRSLPLTIKAGSVKFTFSAKGWTKMMKQQVVKLANWFYTKFPRTFQTVKIHPLFRQLKLNINTFDARGDQCKGFDGLDWEIGPTGNKRTYFQPNGELKWRRWGLNVLGKFPDGDGWLRPFQDEKNWWRAYHGTDTNGVKGIASGAGKPKAFRPSSGGKLGPGVYVSPHLEYCTFRYSQVVTLKHSSGKDARRIVVIFQCAVNPSGLLKEGWPMGSGTGSKKLDDYVKTRYKGQNSEWTFKSEDVRPYGILMCNVDFLEDTYPGAKVGGWKTKTDVEYS